MTFQIKPEDSGWLAPDLRTRGVQKEVDQVMSTMPLMTSEGEAIRGSWNGETTRLDQILKKLAGYYPIVRQLIGDCVSFGWGKGIMVTLACDIIVRGEEEKWPGHEICTEWIYGTSRVVAGRGRLGNSDGSVGAWAVQSTSPGGQGTLLRKVYIAGGTTFDLSKYDPRRSKTWGHRSLPLELLEPEGDKHPTSQKSALVGSFEEAADAIHNGYAVPVCSNQGLTDRRDAQGFVKGSGRWNHCMVFVAVRGDRPGLMVDNTSWGDWVSGPAPDDIPKGCAWLDAKTCDRMLKQDDSYAIPGFKGFENRSENFQWKPFG